LLELNRKLEWEPLSAGRLGEPKASTEVQRKTKLTRWRIQMETSKILIVDDDPDLRRALNIRLRANHYETVQASDGYSAISVAQKEQPNLIILDLGLPAGDGFSVLERLKNSDTLSNIPVIILTARDPHTNEQKTLLAGALAYFQKPAENDELLDVIRATLPNNRLGTALPS
jgi:DNA-binding response OmpR family regulator